MQQEPTVEQRIDQLERLVADLRRQQTNAGDIDQALLQRIDLFLEDMRRLARSQSTGFDALMSNQREQTAMLQTHGLALNALTQGQEQIIEMLLGKKPERND